MPRGEGNAVNHGQFVATDNTEYRAYRAVISPISKRGGDFARNREKNIRASAFSVHVPAATNSKAATFRYPHISFPTLKQQTSPTSYPRG